MGRNMIGDRLKKYRKHKGFNTVQFSEKLGISQGSLSGLETNKSKPSSDTIEQLYRNTDINVGWLLTGEGEMESDKGTGRPAAPDHSDPRIDKMIEMLTELDEASLKNMEEVIKKETDTGRLRRDIEALKKEVQLIRKKVA